MEYIFSQNNRKIIIYDEGNYIFYNVVLGNKVVQAKIIARDYHTDLSCYMLNEKIYCAYITVAKELVWNNIIEDSGVILFADKNELWNMENLKIINVNNSLALFYQVTNPATEEYEIRYLFPEKDKKSKVLLADKKVIECYEMYTISQGLLIGYETRENHIAKYFIMKYTDSDDINIEECVLFERKKLTAIELELSQRDRDYNLAIDNMKKEYDNRLKSDLTHIEQSYRKQYEELTKLTKDIQEEGKKWRELYYKSIKKK